MSLRDAACDIGIKNKIKDLFNQAEVLANNNHAEDALRQYEEAVHLIEKYISADCYRYAIVQLKMGNLFCQGYAPPRYEMALDCFQKAIKIKRRYISDMTEKLFRSFSCADSDIKEFCRKSIVDITNAYIKFMKMRNNANMHDQQQLHQLLYLRDAVLQQ